MEAVECPADDVVELLRVDSLCLEPLAVLNKLQNVCTRSDPVRKPTSGIARQAQKSDDTRSVRVELRMVTRLVVERYLETILVLLGYRTDNRRCAIFVEVNPRLLWLFVSFCLLNPVKFDLLLTKRLDGYCVLVFVFSEALVVKQHVDLSNCYLVAWLVLPVLYAHLVFANVMLEEVEVALVPLAAAHVNFLASELNFGIVVNMAFCYSRFNFIV